MTTSSRAASSNESANRLNWFWSWGALVTQLALASGGSVMVAFATKSIGVIPPDGSEPAGANFLLLSWGVAALLGSFTLNAVNQAKNRNHAKAIEKNRGTQLTKFNDEISSVIGVFIEYLESDKSELASARFFASAVREARHLVSYPSVRICVYQLEIQDVDESVKAVGVGGAMPDKPQQLLVLKAFGGRADQPRPRFTPDTEHGADVIGIAQGTIAVPISDPKSAKINVDRSDDAVWCSALLVPLLKDGDSQGVIMIDTRDQVEFTFEDVSIGWTIATMIALGISSMLSGGRDTRPEMEEVKLLLAGLSPE